MFDTPDDLNKALADFILAEALDAVQIRGRFLFCLSGGSTPKKLYELLATDFYKESMPWQKTFIFWGDERCVARNSDSNNAHLARTVLLNKVDIPVANIYPIESDLAPDNAARAYEIKLHDFFEGHSPRFDLILLGIGEDGHTASLVPNSPVLQETQKWVSEVYYAAQQQFRVTLTLPVINQARNAAFIATGETKTSIIRNLIAQKGPAQYPAEMIYPLNGNLFLYTDKKTVGPT